MCHQEPFPASYAQAFACLWDLVSPQHTHELRYAMTPHLTPMELVSIQTLEAHGNPPMGVHRGLFFCSTVVKIHVYGTPYTLARNR